MYTLYIDRHVVDLVVPVRRVEDTVNKLVPSAAPCFFALLLGRHMRVFRSALRWKPNRDDVSFLGSTSTPTTSTRRACLSSRSFASIQPTNATIQRRAPVVTVPQFEDEPWLLTNNAVARLPHHSSSSNLFSQSCRILPHASYSSSIPCHPRAVRASSKLRFHPDTSLPRHCPLPWPFPVLQATCTWITYKEKG